jgi:dienelactone hydrolase
MIPLQDDLTQKTCQIQQEKSFSRNNDTFGLIKPSEDYTSTRVSAIPSNQKVENSDILPKPAIDSNWSPMPAVPQTFTITTPDGKTLVGDYYPSEKRNAPVVVLMHWSRSDRHGWDVIAPWLQSRGTMKTLGVQTWLQEDWFPENGTDFAVITFDYRTFGDSEVGLESPSDWQVDSLAILEYAARLPDIDPTRIVTVGASIGGDGAIDSCLAFNKKYEDNEAKCIGAFSLSPGSYLEMDYKWAVEEVADQDIKVMCVAGELEGYSAATCEQAMSEQVDNYYDYYLIPNMTSHGLEIFDPILEEDAAQLLLGFVETLLPR